jgi:hypothetical protein
MSDYEDSTPHRRFDKYGKAPDKECRNNMGTENAMMVYKKTTARKNNV